MQGVGVEKSWISWVNPWTCARNILKPASADDRERYHRISHWRAAIGFVAIVVLSVPVKNVTGDFILAERLFSAMLAFIATAIVAALVVGGYCVVRAGRLSVGQRRAAGQVAIRVVAALAVPGFVGAFAATHRADILDFGLLWSMALLWVAVFAPAAAWYTLHWVFGVGDLHPPLAPLIAVLTAAAAWGLDIALHTIDDPRDGTLNGTVIKIGAFLSVCVISAFEWRHVRKPQSASLAGGRPHRGDRPGAASPPAPAQPAADHTDALALGAVLLALCMPPIGIVLGVGALRSASRHHRRSPPLAVAALVISAAILAIGTGLQISGA
jgi:hypothetical protein